MTRAVYLVFTNPRSPDEEGIYNQFYDETHIPEVCATPGFISARRFRLSTVRTPTGVLAQRGYVTIYEIETHDLNATFQVHEERRLSRVSSPLIVDTIYAVYEECTPTPQ